MDHELYSLALRAGERLATKNLMLATVESCTGGWIAQTITSIPGSSGWFERGLVTYSNAAKQEHWSSLVLKDVQFWIPVIVLIGGLLVLRWIA